MTQDNMCFICVKYWYAIKIKRIKITQKGIDYDKNSKKIFFNFFSFYTTVWYDQSKK